MSGAARVPVRHPSAPEWRMICAAAQTAVGEALRHGEEHLTFRGYRLHARSVRVTGGNTEAIELTLSIVSETGALERARIEVARRLNFDSICPIVPMLTGRPCEAQGLVSRWLCQPV